jgi:integrase
MAKEAVGAVQWIERLKRYRARYRNQHVGYFATLEEAEEALESRKLIEAETKAESASDFITLRTFGELWLAEREVLGVVRSVHKERSLWNHHIASAHFIDWPLKKITQHDIQKWIGKMLKKNAVDAIVSGRRRGERREVEHQDSGRLISAKTVSNARGVLKQCFVQAVIEGRVKTSPVTGDLKVRTRARVIENEDEIWTYMSLAEIEAVMRSVADNPFRAAFLSIAIYAGLRQGEIIGLRWRDIVFDGPRGDEILVRRSYDEATKTLNSRREVPMLPQIRAALLEWKAALELEAARGKRLSDVVIDINRLVFPAKGGGLLSDGYDCGWSNHRYRKKTGGSVIEYAGIRQRSGVRDAVTFHCLRHTCASMLVMGGFGFKLDLFEVSRWLGHSNIKVTQRYAHLSPEYLNERIGRLLKFVFPIGYKRAANGDDD